MVWVYDQFKDDDDGKKDGHIIRSDNFENPDSNRYKDDMESTEEQKKPEEKWTMAGSGSLPVTQKTISGISSDHIMNAFLNASVAGEKLKKSFLELDEKRINELRFGEWETKDDCQDSLDICDLSNRRIKSIGTEYGTAEIKSAYYDQSERKLCSVIRISESAFREARKQQMGLKEGTLTNYEWSDCKNIDPIADIENVAKMMKQKTNSQHHKKVADFMKDRTEQVKAINEEKTKRELNEVHCFSCNQMRCDIHQYDDVYGCRLIKRNMSFMSLKRMYEKCPLKRSDYSENGWYGEEEKKKTLPQVESKLNIYIDPFLEEYVDRLSGIGEVNRLDFDNVKIKKTGQNLTDLALKYKPKNESFEDKDLALPKSVYQTSKDSRSRH